MKARSRLRFGMPSATRLEGCSRRYAHQTERLAEFLIVAQASIAGTPNPNRVAAEVLIDAVVVLAVSYLEEYLNCLVGVATLLQEKTVRDFLRTSGSPHEKQVINSGKSVDLVALARRRVSFAERGKKLEQIFELLFNFSPWPDPDAGRLIRDLVRVRNIVVHAGGWPDKHHATDVETPGLIVESNKFFHKLNVFPHLRDMLTAAGMLSVYVENKLLADSRYRL
jgi:hypothetical protein